MMQKEQLLVKRILKGDEKALFAFYRNFSPKLLSFIKRKTNYPEDAEEILQDTLLSSLDALRDFTFRSSLSTFLHAIAKNKIVDFYRKKKLKKILFSQIPQLEAIFSSFVGPEDVLEKKQARINFERALKSLSPRYQKILTLKYFDGKTVYQITKELHVTFKSAESMLFRARMAFAKALKI